MQKISNKREALAFSLLIIRWAGALLFLMFLLFGSLAARHLSREWLLPYTDESKKIQSPDFQGISSADVRTLDLRLQCPVNQPSEGFRVTQIQVGNSLEGYQSAQSCYGESDFMMTADGYIVSAHDDHVGGTCGTISQRVYSSLSECTMANGMHIARLEDFLSLPLSEWFIDLKATFNTNDDQAQEVIEAAVGVINRYGRKDGAVLMVYSVPKGASEYLQHQGIRAGIKGYPVSDSEARHMIDLAAESQFEMMCVNITRMSPELIKYAEDKGVWQLPWALDEYEFSYWQNMIDWGAGGLITAYVHWANRYLVFD